MIIPRPKAEEAAEALGVSLDGLTSDALGKAYRRMAKECHPDHHKNDKLSQWARVSWAKECLEKWLERQPQEITDEPTGDGSCRACNGSGRVNVRKRGFGKPLTMACIVCKGLGTVVAEENDCD